MKKVIAIVGALDTKGDEYKFLKECIEANGAEVTVIDTGLFDPKGLTPDISAEDVAQAGESSVSDIREKGDRGFAVEIMGSGAASIVKGLALDNKIHGIISMGGEDGTAIGTVAMRALPIGFPKLMLSTAVSGDISGFVEETDILMMPSVIDIVGINRLSAQIIKNAAGAITGMVNAAQTPFFEEKPLIAATMSVFTSECVMRSWEIMSEEGCDVLVFHAVGIGGRTMERLIRDGYIDGVLDVTTTELADELVGGILSAGPDRLEAAGEAGIPQIVSAGALDMVNLGGMENIADEFKSRLLERRNPQSTLMRTTAEEAVKIAQTIAGKLNNAKGKTVFVLPKKGFSKLGAEGGPFWLPEADKAFCDAIKSSLNKSVTLVELDMHINDEEIAAILANNLLDCLE